MIENEVISTHRWTSPKVQRSLSGECAQTRS